MAIGAERIRAFATLPGALDLAAIAVSVGLVGSVADGATGLPRLLLATAFAFFVPGRAVVTNWPRIAKWSEVGMSIVLSLSISTLAATVALWAHFWHPAGLFEVEAALSVAAISVSKSRPAGARYLWPSPSWSDLLLPVSLGLWAFSLTQIDVGRIGSYGLPAILPLTFYAALAVLVVSMTAALAQRQVSRLRMALHAGALVVILYGTAPLVYKEARYPWLYKTLGVVQYVNFHGQLDRNIDIYQNWPGFFAFAAWFDRVAGVPSPLAYAKWSQLVVELVALPLLYLSYTALGLPVRQRWIAIVLYSASNWIGQDYFSPQALGTLLSLGIIAMALRWLYVGNSSRDPVLFRRRVSKPGGTESVDQDAAADPSAPVGWLPVLLVLLVFGVLTFTHELSPYMVVVQLASLAVVGRVRPRWLPVALAAIAIGYFIPRFAFVNSHFGLLASIGNFFGNAAPPSSAATWPSVPASEVLITHCSELLSLGIWALALVGAWLRRRSTWTVISLLLLAFSPVVILAVGAYGDEGVLRVYLFSLPWSAALAAAVLSPTPTFGKRRRHVRAADTDSQAPTIAGTLRTSLALVAALTLFFPAFFGDDRADIVSPSEVDTLQTFQETAVPGVVFFPTVGCPFDDTAQYDLFNATTIFGSIVGDALPKPNIASILARTGEQMTGGTEPTYVALCPSALSYNAAHPATYSVAFRILLNSLAHSPEWHLLVRNQGTVIYELRTTGTSAVG